MQIRESVFRRDGKLCQSCLKRGEYTQAQEVDHIKALEDGGTDDPDNLQAICTDCHKAKTAGKVGCDASGIPLDGWGG